MRRCFVLLCMLAGCRVNGAFTCETSDQCRASTGPGSCEAATGFCTFSDADCASGTRYADNAGDGLAGTCTGEQMLIDAPPADTALFDPSVCPARFDKTMTSYPHAKFEIMTATGNYGVVAAMCLAALPGATHPANLRTLEQATQIGALLLAGGPPPPMYVGVIQDPNATTPIAGWINFDGTAFDATLWNNTAPVDPNDGDGNENNHREQAAVVTYEGKVEDATHIAVVPFLCACDGVPVAAQAMTFLQANSWAD